MPGGPDSVEDEAKLISPLVQKLRLLHVILTPRSAWIDQCQPDLLITESTYATTIRDSKRLALRAVYICVLRFIVAFSAALAAHGPVV